MTKFKMPATLTTLTYASNTQMFPENTVEVDFTLLSSVPTLSNYGVFTIIQNPDYTIKVPASLYDTWVASANWSYSSVKSHIVAVEV